MVGTVLSEALWAAGTGGASLTTTAARVGLNSAKYFKTARALTTGVKEAQTVLAQYNRLSSMRAAIGTANKFGKAGEVANLMRFTYTGAGFEAGMEARLYQKEQRDNFNRDFENLNGRPPEAQDIAEFEDNLGSTTNALWATNMALVGTSNFAILGNTFGITSPFKLASKGLNKTLFGIGETTTLGEKGERLASTAIKRNGLQKTLGFSKAILEAPFMEGFVEEGGQAAASSAMENFVTSRYNPSEDAMGMAESVYEGLSHTYGTKEGWKEVGLGALIGLVGGQGTNLASGQGLFKEALEAKEDYDKGSVSKAQNLTENSGSRVTDRILATKLEENLAQATATQNAQEEFNEAERKGDVMGMSNAQSRIMLTSVKGAVEFDYLDEQIKDFRTALDMKTDEEIAEHYDIDPSAAESKRESLVEEYRELGNEYKVAKEFADYVVSENPKELFEDATDIDVREARSAIAYQVAMTQAMEKNMEGAHSALIETLNQLGDKFGPKYMEALNKFNQINRSSKKDVAAVAVAENNLKVAKDQFDKLNKRLLKLQENQGSTPEANKRNANRVATISNKIAEVQEKIDNLSIEVKEKESKLADQKSEMQLINSTTRVLASQLDIIDPLLGEGTVSQLTIEETQRRLAELDDDLEKAAKTNPRLVSKAAKLAKEYRKGLEMWQRNADTLADISDPTLGLKRVGTMMQRKKVAGETTLNFLERLRKTQDEEQAFAVELEALVSAKEGSNVETEKTEQELSAESLGEDIVTETEESILQSKIEEIEKQREVELNSLKGEEDNSAEITKINAKYDRRIKNITNVRKTKATTSLEKIAELKAKLKEVISKSSFVLQNFTDQADNLSQEKAPSQEELTEYEQLREGIDPSDLSKIVSGPIDTMNKKLKERTGLTDEQISRFQELAQKMQDWRMVTATNAKGISVQDILDRIEAYEMEVEDNSTQVTAEQQLEMADKSEKEFSVGQKNTDIIQTMSHVNTAKEGTQIVFSHLSLDSLEKNGYTVVFEREENIGTEQEPIMAEVYTISNKDGDIEIRKIKSNSRIAVPEDSHESFLKGMNFQTIKYKLKTAWGYVFQNGTLLKSDFGIDSIDQSETEILHPELIYELNPGEKLSFVVSIKDAYNYNDMQKLIAEGDSNGAMENMAIYITNSEGKVVGMLKAGKENKDSNFNKVRKEAIKVLKSKLQNKNLTIEDILDGNTETSFTLPFEVEVDKVFIGTPNVELNEDGALKIFKISKEQAKNIVGKGFAEAGKLEKEDPEVRMTFIPKDKNTPYVIIKQGNTKIAFPVGVTPTASTLQDQVLTIMDSDQGNQAKITEVIKLLKRNGVEPAQFNSNMSRINEKELNALLASLDDAERTYSKEELRDMTLEAFLDSAEIVINLDKPAFLSPKVKTTLSSKMLDKDTSKTTKNEALTAEEKNDLIVNNSEELAKATTKEEVVEAVINSGDSVFQEEFNNNKEFRDQVEKFALGQSVVPIIETEYTIERLIEETVDIESEDVPLSLREEFKNDVEDLKNNPTKAKVKALGKKLILALKNRYAIVSAAVDTKNLFYIATTQSEEEMFDQGFVRVNDNYYKKIDNKYELPELIEGLYAKYRKGTLPNHMVFKEGLTLEQFSEEMPKTLMDTYKKYYDSRPAGPLSKKAVITGNEQYLKEEFKGDFATFINKEAKKGSKLYYDVLQHFTITDLGVTKRKLLSRAKIDAYKAEMGPLYDALIEYSLINKHIDLQEQPQTTIFAEDEENQKRIEAVNNPNTKEAKGAALLSNSDGSITLGKGNADFVTHRGQVYEKVQDAGNGEYDYFPIAKVDNVFYVTEVSTPFINKPKINTKEINGTKTKVNKTDKEGGIDC